MPAPGARVVIRDAEWVILESEPGARQSPSTHVVCSDENGRWVLRRVVEKSFVVDHAVFVDTRININTPGPAAFDDHVNLLARLGRLADRLVSLQPEDAS